MDWIWVLIVAAIVGLAVYKATHRNKVIGGGSVPPEDGKPFEIDRR